MTMVIKTLQRKIWKKLILYTLPLKEREKLKKTRLDVPEIEESPRAMDVDEVIEEPSWSKKRLLETREIVEALVTQEP
jgi:hypothetical protein